MSDRLDDARGIALRAMIDGMEKMLAADSPVKRLSIGWRGGDETCEVIGQQILGDDFGDGEWEDLDLYIATQIYAGGGHTGVIGDFVKASGVRSEVLLTCTVERDIHGRELPLEVIERLGVGVDAVEICPHVELAAAARWLMGEIRERRPRRVFLFHHPQDAVAVAGARACLCGELYLVHHADRKPTLGLHQKGSRVVDLSPFTAEFTRRVLGRSELYAPMVVRDPGEPPRRESRLPLTTASSGAAHKFGDDYAENIARLLEATGGGHVHIGFLKRRRLEAIRDELLELGIPADRFRYVEWVSSLAGALIDLEVDLCIGSAPMGGARTAIEAAAAGVPLLGFLPEFSTRFGVSHVKPESWPIWKNIGELVVLLERIDPVWISEQGVIGREFFIRQHHPQVLAKALENLASQEWRGIDEVPLEELFDARACNKALRGEWLFLRKEFSENILD